MESVAEIQDMRVSQLKEFLKRNEVDTSSIQRSDGKDGPPRKGDLLSAALNVRADYENPREDGPTSPKAPRNIFQSGYSPSSSRITTPGPKTRSPTRKRASSIATSDAMPSEAGKTSERRTKAEGSAGRKPKPRRRSSVGWVNPNFLAQLTPKKSSVRAEQPEPAEIPKVANKTSEPEEDAETYDNDFGDEGDQIVISDYDSSGAFSGPESDGGSVIETDEDEETSVNQFKLMKAYEVRAWLSEKGVQFNVRSKKAELISIATAHALYLENLASDSKPKSDRNSEPAPEPKPKYIEEIEITEVPAVPQRVSGRRTYSKNVNAEDKLDNVSDVHVLPTKKPKTDTKPKKPREDAATERFKYDAVVPSSKPYAVDPHDLRTNLKRGPIKAPQPDEDNDIVEEVIPVLKSKRNKKRHGRPPGSNKKRAEPRFSLPKIRLPSITITRRGVSAFLGCSIIALIFAIIYRAWSDSQRPFCSKSVVDDNSCIPCPEFARHCEGHDFECINHYKKSGKKCVEDSAVNDYAIHLEFKIRKFLAVQQGDKQCGMTAESVVTKAELRGLYDPAQESGRSGRFDTTKFDSAFEKATERLKDDDDIIYKPSTVFDQDTFESDVVILKTSCKIKNFLWQNFRYVLLIAILLIFTLRWYIRRFFRERERARVEHVYQMALDFLREVRVSFNDDDKGDAFMRDTQLREELLGRTTNESVKLWAKVEVLLRGDTRVLRSGPRSIKGMPCYVYEWRGNLRRPSLGSAGHDGFRSYPGMEAESRRRLSFGSASRRHSGGFDASSPPGRQLSGSPPPVQPSPGYSRLLNFWNS